MPDCWRRWIAWFGLVFVVTGFALGIAIATPALAADSHPPLTLDGLRQRLAAPVQREGRAAIDLRYYTIDLRPDSPLTDSFYRLLSNSLQRPATAPALDLSYAIVQGDLDLQRLGQREPLYGETLSPLLSEAGQAQLKRDRQRLLQLSRLSQSLLIQGQGSSQQIYLFKAPLVAVQTRVEGQVLGGDTFFLGRVLASGAVFEQGLSLPGARFNQPVNLSGADFRQRVQAKGSLFFDAARFDQSQFRAGANFQGAEFKADVNFSRAVLAGDLNFSRVQWQGVADFARTVWLGSAFFVRSYFAKALFFTEARFDAPLVLRQARFGEPINLRNAMLGSEVDFGDALFPPSAYLNVAGLEFSLEQTQILGTPGKIGRVFSVPQLAGNETLLRNLERNFRRLEQISDANYIAYTAERLRLKAWQQRLLGTNINTASVPALVRAGFTETQAAAVVEQRQTQTFIGTEGVLSVAGVDLAAYLKVRDRIFARDAYPITQRLALGLRWLWLGGLVVLSRYGTSFGLTFGLGLVAIPTFALMFWLVDRYRRRRAPPILPPLVEGLWLVGGCSLLLGLGLNALLRAADYPLLTLGFLFVLLVPVPAVLIGLVIKRGRYHDLMDESYFVEDGSMRQLRLLIARLPVIPKFPFFRDRYTYLLLDRRWNWLNYLDFSLNNWLKFGFNDIRLRDEHVPGLVTALVWYQWGLGLLYTALLLWTLSRTIPGLNLLIYF
ncbi:pentapeptide repeat-containing protein [Nodosilinea sp. LEGE 06152]|uniref:pentapeptide repeat-containing protein n=1 Tax=Nodosilinea sp. LEGE 06152 TaxID=2777966 RepID=UPI00187E5FD5|nr:pentapeptide repeat-containing protein [Nodosilinea sp. LEGE 06152]